MTSFLVYVSHNRLVTVVVYSEPWVHNVILTTSRDPSPIQTVILNHGFTMTYEPQVETHPPIQTVILNHGFTMSYLPQVETHLPEPYRAWT